MAVFPDRGRRRNQINAPTLLAIGLLLAPAASFAQSATPQSKTWNFKEIIADDQYAAPPFKGIVQAQGGQVYVADRLGVLEFDGVKWHRLPLPAAHVVTAMGVTKDDEIVVGGLESLLLVSSANHAVLIKDLKDQVPGGLLGLGHIWEFAAGQERWCVRTEPKLICADASGMHVLAAEKRFGRLFSVRGELYVRDDAVGLKRVAGRSLERVVGGEFYADRALVALLPYGVNGLAGLSIAPFEIATWSDPHSTPVPVTVAGADRLDGSVDGARLLRDGAVGLPYVNGDLVILGSDWTEIARFQAKQFGASPGAQAIHADDEGGLWISWNNAVTRIDWPSRVSLFKQTEGIHETPVGVLEHARGVIAYTNKNFAVLNNGDITAPFEALTPSYPWILGVVGHHDEFLVLTVDGVWNSRGEQLLLANRRVYSQFVSPTRPDEVLLGLRFGVARIVHEGSRWVVSSVRNDLSFDVFGVVQDGDGDIWLASNLGRLARVVPATGSADLADGDLQEFDQRHGVPTGLLTLGLIGEAVHVASQDGIFHYSQGRFEPSPRFAFEQTGPVKEFRTLDGNEVLVVSHSGRLRVLTKGFSGDYKRQLSAFDAIAGLGNISDVMIDRSGIVWLATDSGVVRVDPAVAVPAPGAQQVLIREISSGDTTLYSGHGAVPILNLAAGDSIRFGFALPSYRAPEINSYRSRIRHLGGDERWSTWSNEPRRDFTNLPAGELIFEVEARDAAGAVGGTAAVPITVTAPWYRRTATIAAFWSILGLLVIVGVQWRVRALRARSTELERLVAMKTEALQLAASTDPLTGLWNRHRFGQWVREQAPAIGASANAADDADPADVIVCVIDLDHFKRINDQHGHAAGDTVLRALASKLQRFKRDDDLIFRFGGEEFVYLGVGRQRGEGAQLANQIVTQLAETNVELDNGVELDPTASVGWSVYPFYRQRAELFSIDFVLGVADRALYWAKENGRNRAVGYLPNIGVDEIDRTQADWRTQLFTRHPEFLKLVQGSPAGPGESEKEPAEGAGSSVYSAVRSRSSK